MLLIRLVSVGLTTVGNSYAAYCSNSRDELRMKVKCFCSRPLNDHTRGTRSY